MFVFPLHHQFSKKRSSWNEIISQPAFIHSREYLEDAGLCIVMVISVPRRRRALSLFSIHTDAHCLFMDTAGRLRMCVPLWTVQGLCRVDQLAPSYQSVPSTSTVCCQKHHLSAVFRAYKIHTVSIHQPLPAGPIPVVLLAMWRQVDQCWFVGAFWLLSPRLCWEDPIQLWTIGNINPFITDMWMGEWKCGS